MSAQQTILAQTSAGLTAERCRRPTRKGQGREAVSRLVRIACAAAAACLAACATVPPERPTEEVLSVAVYAAPKGKVLAALAEVLERRGFPLAGAPVALDPTSHFLKTRRARLAAGEVPEGSDSRPCYTCGLPDADGRAFADSERACVLAYVVQDAGVARVSIYARAEVRAGARWRSACSSGRLEKEIFESLDCMLGVAGQRFAGCVVEPSCRPKEPERERATAAPRKPKPRAAKGKARKATKEERDEVEWDSAEESSEEPSDTDAAEAVYSFVFDPTGLPKYDDFLATTRDLVAGLDEADRSIRALVPSARQAAETCLRVVGEARKLGDDLKDPGAILKTLASSLKVKAGLELYVSAEKGGLVLRVRPIAGATIEKPEIVKQVERALEDLNTVIANVVSIPKSLGTATQRSKDLALQGADLVASAKSDFTGLKARKLPACAKSLKQAIDFLKGVPDRVTSILDGAKTAAQDIRSFVP